MIRTATDADLAAVRALQELLASPAPSLLEMAFETDAATVLVATDDGSVVGYAIAVPGAPDVDPSIVYLAEVVVAPAVRREGYGAALIDAVADRFAEYDQLRLTARADAEGPLAFYRENGFWELADLPGYYDGTDGLLLVREL